MIDPRGMTAFTWCDSSAEYLSSYGSIPKLMSEKDWSLWADIVTQIPSIAEFHPPDPRGFHNWFEWAMRFVQAVLL